MDERCSVEKRDNTTRRIWFALLVNLIETAKHNTGYQRPLRNSFACHYHADGRNMLCQCAALLLGAHEYRNEAKIYIFGVFEEAVRTCLESCGELLKLFRRLGAFLGSNLGPELDDGVYNVMNAGIAGRARHTMNVLQGPSRESRRRNAQRSPPESRR